MTDFPPTILKIESQMDVIFARQKAREITLSQGFGLTDQTRFATAVSELTRNALQHGGGGTCILKPCEQNGCHGVHVIIEDAGPGILDVEKAMEDGFSTDHGMGRGLSASKRLVHKMDIDSEPGKTVVIIEMHLKP